MTSATKGKAGVRLDVPTPTATEISEAGVQAVIARLVERRSGMVDPLDLPRSLSLRVAEKYASYLRLVDAAIDSLPRHAGLLTALRTELPTVEEHLALMTAIRETLAREAEALGPDDVRRRNYELSLRAVDFGPEVLSGTGYMTRTTRLGQLLAERTRWVAPPPAPNGQISDTPWPGTVLELDLKAADLRARRDDALYRLETSMRDAEALLAVALPTTTG